MRLIEKLPILQWLILGSMLCIGQSSATENAPHFIECKQVVGVSKEDPKDLRCPRDGGKEKVSCIEGPCDLGKLVFNDFVFTANAFGARATVGFGDMVIASLGASMEARISEPADKSDLEQLAGDAVYFLASKLSQPFTVKIQGWVYLTGGHTIFQVTILNADTARLKVFEGEVSINTPTGRELLVVKENFQVEIQRDMWVSLPSPILPQENIAPVVPPQDDLEAPRLFQVFIPG